MSAPAAGTRLRQTARRGRPLGTVAGHSPSAQGARFPLIAAASWPVAAVPPIPQVSRT